MKRNTVKISMLHMLGEINHDYFHVLTKLKAATSLVFASMSMSGVYAGKHPILFEDVMTQQSYLFHMNNVRADMSGNGSWNYLQSCLTTDIENTGYTSVLGTDDLSEQLALYGTYDEGSALKETSKVHISIFQDIFSNIDSIFQMKLSLFSMNYITVTIDELYNLVIEIKHMR